MNMRINTVATLALSLLPLSALAETGEGNRWGLNVFGLSYHTDRSQAQGMELNELNFGLGVRREFGKAFTEASLYKNSFGHTARYVGAGYQFHLKNWRLGGMIVAGQGKGYNENRPFVAPVPLLSYDFGRVLLNTTYFPKVKDINAIETFGTYITIRF